MKTLLTSLILFPLLVCLIFSVAASVQAADKKSDENLIYVYEWQLKRNTMEVTDTMVKATIRAEFSDAKLISFDVSKSMQ